MAQVVTLYKDAKDMAFESKVNLLQKQLVFRIDCEHQFVSALAVRIRRQEKVSGVDSFLLSPESITITRS